MTEINQHPIIDISKDNFNLSECISSASKIRCENDFEFLSINAIKEFIRIIKNKVLLDWKGQNEFIDWLKLKAGDKLI